MEGRSLNEKRETMMEPLLETSPKGGGAITMPFIIANGTLEKVACYGLIPNMTLYLKKQYGLGMTTTSNILFYWVAAINFTPVVGAVLADSYVGRYNMIGIGSVLSFLGTVLLCLTTMVPGLSPLSCHESNNSHCSSSTTTTSQLLLLCTSLGMIAVGGGGIRSSSLAFGIDQLLSSNNEHDDKNGGFMDKFYRWFYATFMLSILTGNTLIVFIQDKMGWQIGFGVSVVLMFLSTLCFFLGSSFYVKVKAKPNLITELIQVIVASFKKRNIETAGYMDKNMIYHHRKGSSTLYFPTQKFRFLNKACVFEDAEQELTTDGRARDPWRLCTVDQVEDLKSLLKVIPIWSTGVITFVNMSQGSFSVLQAESMNRKITANFEIPAGSFGTFSLACLALWVPLYDHVILPIVSRIKGKPTGFSTKQRIGAGIFVSFITMVVTAVVEGIRRSHGRANDPPVASNQVSSMSALWLLPQYCLMGIMEALVAIPQSEFYMAELPNSMWSIASSLCSLEISLANVLASFLMTTMDEVTKRGGGQESWVSSNLNKGHFDYYFWALSGLSLLNFLYFLFCCWTYGPCKGEQQKDGSRDDEADHLLV